MEDVISSTVRHRRATTIEANPRSGEWHQMGTLRTQPYGDTVTRTALAAACFVNLRRNRTLHCGLTGPLFAIAAIVAGLTEAGISDIDERVMWGIVLVLIALAFLVQWRTVGRQPRASNA